MSRPRNTRNQIISIPALHGMSIPGAIEKQEAEGAAAMQRGDCEIIPVEINGGTEADLIALGFVLGPVDPADRLMREATLPAGWKRTGTGHSMHTDIVDELGRKRIGIFFKNAWYDRRADLSITSVYGYIGTCLHQGQTPILDGEWATREAVLEALDEHARQKQDYLPLYECRDDEHSAGRVTELRGEIAAIKALRASVTGGA
ncbi:hypothetical protein DQ384_26280 [Sphaerisporangium album]|uniref:Uncharacterized protein n=1 Tax=Sphaerisporangium album TaxID=509200 RepID=A0A367FBA4_9ACTN|nr:hypothetical protein [Sphaerisporangium album]RCG27229.1 hypothetical protein DQ384_26280 [Sphaerisporangium album]